MNKVCHARRTNHLIWELRYAETSPRPILLSSLSLKPTENFSFLLPFTRPLSQMSKSRDKQVRRSEDEYHYFDRNQRILEKPIDRFCLALLNELSTAGGTVWRPTIILKFKVYLLWWALMAGHLRRTTVLHRNIWTPAQINFVNLHPRPHHPSTYMQWFFHLQQS